MSLDPISEGWEPPHPRRLVGGGCQGGPGRVPAWAGQGSCSARVASPRPRLDLHRPLPRGPEESLAHLPGIGRTSPSLARSPMPAPSVRKYRAEEASVAGGRGVSTSKPPPSSHPEEARPSPGLSWSWPGDHCHLRPLQAWPPAAAPPRPLHPLSRKELHSAGAQCMSPGGGWTGQLG